MGIENDHGFETLHNKNAKRKVQILKSVRFFKKRVNHNLPFANAKIRTGGESAFHTRVQIPRSIELESKAESECVHSWCQ